MEGRGTKRKVEEKIYRFKILLPDRMTVELRLTDPGHEMRFQDFVNAVKKEYLLLRRQQEPKEPKRPVNWNSEHIYLEDANDRRIRHTIHFAHFNPHKCHILKFHDGSPFVIDTYENMWDLTPDTDLLRELPEDYTFETALADLIDNSLQAVWSNGTNERKLIRVDIMKDKISIFDTGPGMDNSDENSIVKWGKMGASLHRSSKAKAIGGKPPYLMPYFGMFGYGGPIASMHLGRRALVSSKTKESRKVYTLHLEREALLSSSRAELTWRTNGGMRNPSEEEIEESPQGSFTKVEILELKVKKLDVTNLQCRLKDIYFPYIQCDDLSNKGKTATPVTFQVNDVDLAEIEGGEVSIANLLSCNGPEFVFRLHFTVKHGLRVSQEANACLKCVYFPIHKGKESIEEILGRIEAQGSGITENFETYSRVAVRRLGRLLPEARWARLPFMDFSQKKGEKAQLLKRCCARVKCYIETDAGFNPTPSKTDLAHHNVFSIALKNFGSKKLDKEKEADIEIFYKDEQLNPSTFERKYQDWLLKMHDDYDHEADTGEDDPILVVSPKNKRGLGISSDVVRVHRALRRKGTCWKSGQKIKVMKGACPRLHKTNIYATIEYFLIEGFQGDAGGEARIICRPLDVADKDGCILDENNENASLDIHGSLSLPISVVDSGKCLAVNTAEWNIQLEKQRLRAPSMIDFLGAECCQELEVDGALTFGATINAGVVPPSEIVAVVRPASFISSTIANSLDQKNIVKLTSEMSMEVKFRRETKECNVEHIYSSRIASSCRKGISGLYIFPLGQKLPNLFQQAGVYTFLFSLVGSSCEDCKKNLKVRASSAVGKWTLLSDNDSQPYTVRVGSAFQLAIACFDKYDNRIPFVSLPVVTGKLNFDSGVLSEIGKLKTSLSSDKLTLQVKDVLIESSKLDEIRPTYEATLLICPQDNLIPLTIPCKVNPGSLNYVAAHPPLSEKELLPGFVVNEFLLEMFDKYNNHVAKGLEVQLNVDGYQILDQIGSNRKVDDNGCIDLGGLLKVTAGFGKTVSVSLSSDDRVVFKKQFQTGKRELILASKVPEYLTAGSQLENVVFQVVDSEGIVDETIHDEDKSSQSHTLKLKSELFNSEGCVQYTFTHGCCTVPVIPLPLVAGSCCFIAAHSRFPELQLSFNVSVTPAPNLDYDEFPSPCSEGKVLLLQDSSSLKHVGDSPAIDIAGNLVLSIANLEKGLEDDICKYGQRIGHCENQLKVLNEMKMDCEISLSELQAAVQPHLFNALNYISTKEEITEQIKSRSHPAAAILCHLSRDLSFQGPQKHFMQDIIGLVALLGTVRNNELSRILAEYLGEDQMLAIVCSSYEAVTGLEKHKENGEIDRELALHGEVAALGKSISGRYLAICLEDLRVYREVEENEAQRTLALPNPIMPSSGNVPPGFIGYAVNMINLDAHQLDITTKAGHGLRETLFYRLFGELQVYKTREHMSKARACIMHGAVSLDGGILRENGIISLGYGNPEIFFPVEMKDEMHLSPVMVEVKKQLEVKQRELQEITSRIEKCTRNREKAMKKFRKKQDQFNSFMDQMEPVLKGC